MTVRILLKEVAAVAVAYILGTSSLYFGFYLSHTAIASIHEPSKWQISDGLLFYYCFLLPQGISTVWMYLSLRFLKGSLRVLPIGVLSAFVAFQLFYLAGGYLDDHPYKWVLASFWVVFCTMMPAIIVHWISKRSFHAQH